MSTRKTPFMKIDYPWASDVVNVADVQSMAQDIDSALERTAMLGANFSRFSSVLVQRFAAQSITKATQTPISFDTVILDNGTDSPLANGPWWNASQPTRLTAPSPCIVLACGLGSLQVGTTLGTNGAVQASVTLNGASSGAGLQGSKWGPGSPVPTGYQAASAVTMWKLNAADYLELKVFWTGSPVGPINTVTGNQSPSLSLMMIGLPAVA